jgi:putative inorganic carbon (HCO3(-)) transporter
VPATRGLISAGLILLMGAASVALAAAGAVATGSAEVYVGATALAAAAAVAYLALRAEPAWALSVGIALSIFSGHSDRLGFSIGPDRLLIAAGLLGVALQGLRDGEGRAKRPPIRVETAHWLLFAALLWAIGSAWWAGTLTQSSGAFALLDRFGLVPFLAFLVAPVAFRTDHQRAILMGTLIVTGAYLGITALFEGVGLDALVFPQYIVDPSVGIHADRARGPFTQAVAMGLGLFLCGAAAAMGAARWRARPWVRAGCAAVAALCTLGMLFTLTRAIWLGGVLAVVVVVWATPRLWRFVPAGTLVLGLLIAGAWAFVPGLEHSARERSSDEAPVWVRENTNNAALAIVAERPLFGVGWERFKETSPRWFRQDDEIPMSGAGEGVHNVVLANASELGLPGAFLWLAGATLAIGGALVRRVRAELWTWKVFLLAATIMIVVAGSVGPLPYAFPLLVLWTVAGLLRSDPATPPPEGDEAAAGRDQQPGARAGSPALRHGARPGAA